MIATKSHAIATILIASALISAGVMISGSRLNVVPQLVSSVTSSTARTEFPQINASQLLPSQQKVIAILKQEYGSQPKGTKYSEGVNEPWCADFVSWVFNKADQPLINPNSGSWRIPGTYTLRAYYESTGRFKPAKSGYSPKVGDVMLYDNPSPFGQHVNIVIKNDGGVITTIGGNEPGGIRIFVHTTPDKAGFIGYGVFST